MKFELTEKQGVAYQALNDDTIVDILYGGGAGGGKSHLGCLWIISCCLNMPGSTWLICRKELSKLKDSTMMTFFGLLNKPTDAPDPKDRGFGLVKGKNYDFNSTDNVLKFRNGSMVFFREADFLPSDPEYNRLGSTEYTGAFVDEAQELQYKAIDIIRTRIRNLSGSTKDYKWETTPKILMTCNPMRNWIYTNYYRPHKAGELEDWRLFIPAVATDNPHLPEIYIENLRRADKITKERLLYGNFEYEDNAAALFDLDDLKYVFDKGGEPSGAHFLCSDVAGKGDDSTVFYVFHGFKLVEYHIIDKNDGQEYFDMVRHLKNKYKVANSRYIYDADGMGAGYSGIFPGAIEFKAQHRAIEERPGEKPYIKDLKSQCYRRLAQMVLDRKLDLSIMSKEHRERLSSELMAVEQKDIDKDQPFSIISKDEMKEKLQDSRRGRGGSPDLADALAYFMYFFLKPRPQLSSLQRFGKSLGIT